MTFRLTNLVLSILAFTTNSERIIVGKIYSSHIPEMYNEKNIFVMLSCDNKSIDTVRTNEEGEFLAKIPGGKQKKIDIFYSGIGFGTVYLRHIKELTSDTTNFQIDVAEKYKPNIFGKAICPKCNKTNQVYKIRYGDAPVFTFRMTESGDTTYSPIHNGVYEAGTCVSSAQSPLWYCDRDKKKF